MDRGKAARDEWAAAFGKLPPTERPDFDLVFSGKINLSEIQVELLFAHSVRIREDDLANGRYYRNIWSKLLLNEKLAVLDAAYNAESIIKLNKNGTKTSFLLNMEKYTATGDRAYFNHALWELYRNSNKERNSEIRRGIQARRLAQATMLNTQDVDLDKIPTPAYHIQQFRERELPRVGQALAAAINQARTAEPARFVDAVIASHRRNFITLMRQLRRNPTYQPPVPAMTALRAAAIAQTDVA